MLSNYKRFYIVVILIIIAQIVIAFQGFDVCDEGFSLTFYQQIFKNPHTVEYNFAYWLSGIVGGVWYTIYDEGGIFWFRILAIIFNTSTFIISYKLLKNYISKYHALIGLTMVLFVNNFGYLAFYHNHLTAFLAVSSVYFLYTGIKNKKLIAIGVSGLLIGINIFSRLPNITLLVFVVTIPLVMYLNKQELIKSIKPIFTFILGAFLGIALVLGVMYYLDHLEIMQKAFLSIIKLGGNEGSTHNVVTLLHSYIYNYKKVLFLFFVFLLISTFLLYDKYIFKNNRYIKAVKYIMGFIFYFYLFKNGGIHIIYAIGYVGALGILLTKQKVISIKILAFLGLLMMLFLPLGSAGGIYDSGYMWIWLTLPFFLHFLFGIENLTFSLKTKRTVISKEISNSMIKSLLLTLVLSYFTAKVYSISQEAYFDKGSRFEKTYKINSKLARSIYTTEERASIVNELLVNLQKYVSSGDYLLVYDSMPMIHFLTETRPYMYNPWVWIYDGYSFEQKVKKAETEISILPIVVQQKFKTIGEFSKPMNDYMNETKEEGFLYNNKRTAVMNSFLERNEYEIIWSNSYFNIYRTNKK